MRDGDLYDIIIKNTISRTEIHLILILLEFFLSFYPYLSSTLKKLRYFNSIFSYSNSDSIFIFFKESKHRNYSGTINLSSPLMIYLLCNISLCIIFLLIYIFYYFFEGKRKRENFLTKIMINILGLVYFRYFSFFFIDALQSLLFLNIIEDKRISYIIRFFFLIIQIFYLVICYWYINEYTFHYRITNNRLSKRMINYPFDLFSEKHDKFCFFLKIVCAFESNYLIKNDFIVGKVNFFLNLLIIGFSIIHFLSIWLFNFLFFALQGNFTLYFVRKFTIFFGFFQLLFTFASPIPHDSYLDISNIFINCLLSLFLLAMSWLYYEKKQIKKGIEETNPDAVICILINKQIKTDDKVVINLQNFNLFELIVTWFKLYHVNKGDEKYKSKEKHTDEEISSYNYILYYFQLLQNANKKKIE